MQEYKKEKSGTSQQSVRRVYRAHVELNIRRRELHVLYTQSKELGNTSGFHNEASVFSGIYSCVTYQAMTC